jgi:phosphoribosylformimino-5-aminoimidazole carboxamide ribotide isomerase
MDVRWGKRDMIIFPAIDLLGGKVVRLEQGKREHCTVYGEDPVAQALAWQEQGAEALHVVDLDGAFSGIPANLGHVRKIVRALTIPIQLGGGLRTVEVVDQVLQTGVTRAILGTKACESPDFVRELVERFGGERIAVGVDAKDGQVAVKGWTESTGVRALDLLRQVEKIGVQTVIYTDIATDGMFTGPNYASLQEILGGVKLRVIASGGIGTVDHITRLRRLPGLYGAIVGKALYDKKFRLAEVLG